MKGIKNVFHVWLQVSTTLSTVNMIFLYYFFRHQIHNELSVICFMRKILFCYFSHSSFCQMLKNKWFFLKNAVLSPLYVYTDSHNKGFCAFMWIFYSFFSSPLQNKSLNLTTVQCHINTHTPNVSVVCSNDTPDLRCIIGPVVTHYQLPVKAFPSLRHTHIVWHLCSDAFCSCKGVNTHSGQRKQSEISDDEMKMHHPDSRFFFDISRILIHFCWTDPVTLVCVATDWAKVRILVKGEHF